jgi:hypothetical protein
MAGGNSASNIAKWNGTNWSALGSGIEGDVYALAVSGEYLYAAGSFTGAVFPPIPLPDGTGVIGRRLELTIMAKYWRFRHPATTCMLEAVFLRLEGKFLYV